MAGNVDDPCMVVGQMSHNIIMRNELDLYVNVIECKSYPGVCSRYNDVDMVIIRMNIEGEYNMLEHQVCIE